MTKPLVFVYGTLRRACSTGAHQRYLAGAEFIGDASVAGRLYQISYYPALVADAAAGRVRGEVYRLLDEAQLMALDDYEECPQPWHCGQEYRREPLAVTLASGATLTAWAYVYQWPLAAQQRIPSGDFLAQFELNPASPSDNFSDS